MNGEFSRLSIDQSSDYTGVLLQQGRALVDAEWNEQCALLNEQMRRAIAEVIDSLRADNLTLTLTAADIARTEVDRKSRWSVRVPTGVFYVQGARCQQQSSEHVPLHIHPMDDIKADRDPFVISVHAWERAVTSVEEPRLRDMALRGADSAMRSQIAWELQIDPGRPSELGSYSSWITQFRGAIKLRHKSVSEASPALYRIMVVENCVTNDEGVADPRLVRFAWARENPTIHAFRNIIDYTELGTGASGEWIECLSLADLQADKPGRFMTLKSGYEKELRRSRSTSELYYRRWDGCQLVHLDENTSYLRLDECIDVSFSADKKYRQGDSWLIAYRGEQKTDSSWILPTGQHYYSHALSGPAIPTNSATDHTTAISDHKDARESDSPFFFSSKQLRRLVGANLLADATEHIWLKKWLGTALISEVLTADYLTFWERVSASMPPYLEPDAEVRDETKRIWLLAQGMDGQLTKHSSLRHLKTLA